MNVYFSESHMNVIMNIKGFGTVTEEEIIEFEKETGFTMPDDYRAFLKEYNGGVLQGDNNFIEVKDAEDCIVVDVLFGIGKNLKRDFNIKDWLKEFEGEGFPKDRVIIIGVDEGGILILLSNSEKEEKKGVFAWDDGFELKQSSEESCLYKLADTFTEFVQKLRD